MSDIDAACMLLVDVPAELAARGYPAPTLSFLYNLAPKFGGKRAGGRWVIPRERIDDIGRHLSVEPDRDRSVA